jgi:hypothetical protein
MLMVEAGKADRLRDLLLDYGWLQARLDATDVNALIADCESLPDDAAIRVIRWALRMSAHVLKEDKSALAHHLHGRLYRYAQQGEIAALRAACAAA